MTSSERQFTQRDLDVEKRLGTLENHIVTVIDTLERIEEHCRNNSCRAPLGPAPAPPPPAPIMSGGRAWALLTGVSAFISVTTSAFIAALPGILDGLSKLATVVFGYFQSKP